MLSTTTKEVHTPTLKTVHPFPARMASSIALAELPKNGRHIILDPMSGSGTSLVTARMKGHRAIGFDIDPLAVMMARVWTTSIDPDDLRASFAKMMKRAHAHYAKIGAQEAYPQRADEKTKKFVSFWFDTDNRKQLAALSRAISTIRDDITRQVCWCGFSRLIITKASGVSLAMDVSHSRPHRKYDQAPVRAFDAIERQFETILRNAPFQVGTKYPKVRVSIGDARRLPLADGSVSAVITSPPYLNAIDYMRGHKLALVWMGHSIDTLTGIRSGSVGAESGLSDDEKTSTTSDILRGLRLGKTVPNRTRKIVQRYIADMDGVVSEIARVTRKKGKIVFVVGDSTLHGRYIKNSAILRALGKKHGLRLTSSKRRPLPEGRRYLPAPSFMKSGEALRKRMREEIILCFSK